MKATRILLLLAGAALVFGGCADEAAEPEATGDLSEVVLPGKTDNYLSPTSREYNLWGIGEILLEEEWRDKTFEEREARVQDLLAYRFKAYSHFINVYLTDKGHGDANESYGGFSGLVRSTSLDWVREPMDDEGMVWAFIWEIQMGAPRDLVSRLPFELRDNGEQYLVVKMPKLDEYALQSSNYPKDFDPATYNGEIDDIEVVVEPQEESVDGWPGYRAMFEDGLLDVTIIVGGDYNDKRYDLKSAEEIFAWLKKAGYAHPAKKLAELTVDAAPFTKSLVADGRTVAIEVTLLYPDMELGAVRKRIVDAYEKNDLVIYDGHAGQDPEYSGIVYHYNPRHALSVVELAALKLPEKYQLFVFNGCKTYSAYPEGVYKNPAKNPENLDIVSTVNFSWLTMMPYTTSAFLGELLAVRSGSHDPRTYLEILSSVNKGANHNVYYGVHGIDDNSHVNPYADTATLCSPCSSDAGCPGQGNLCVRFPWGSVCGAECTSDDGCPSGYACTDIAKAGAITGRQCLPVSHTCQ
jgi:hypothetical protein